MSHAIESSFSLTADQQQKSLRHLTATMLALQDDINSQIDSNWREYNHPWYRAAWTECSELLDHHGWKWWKKQDPDHQQIYLELVDIWHFALSDLLQHQSDNHLIIEDICSQLTSQPHTNHTFLEAVETLSQSCLVHKRIDLAAFFNLMTCAQLNYLELFKQYLGKNVLNHFRQDKGYKQGEYRKIWQGKEDNVHLSEILEQMELQEPSAPQQLYKALENRYHAKEQEAQTV